MVTPIEVGVVVLVLGGLIAAYLILKAIKPLIVNTVLGLVVLFLAGVVGYGVKITLVVILIVAFGGIPGAILVILLAHLDILFEPALLTPLFGV